MRFHRLDLNHLVTLETLLTERSLTRTAERHHLTQPAISNALTKLREFFGDELLVRRGRDMERTPFSEELLPALRNALAELQRVAHAKPGFDPATAQRMFRVVASDYVAQVFLPALIARIAIVAPNVTVTHVPLGPDAQLQFEDGSIDAIVAPLGVLHDKKFPHRTLYTEDWVCIARRGHPLAGTTISVDDYFVGPHASPSYKQFWLDSRWKPSAELQPRAAVHLPFSAIPSLVARTDYLSVLPRRLVQIYENALDLVRIEIVPATARVAFVVQWQPELGMDPFKMWMLDALVRTGADLDAESVTREPVAVHHRN